MESNGQTESLDVLNYDTVGVNETISIDANKIEINTSNSNNLDTWSLVVAIFTLVAAIIISLIERHHSAKLNSINMLKGSLDKPFDEYLIKDFCEKVTACKYVLVSVNDEEIINVSFDKFCLLRLQNTISGFLGEIAYLKYAVPFKYSRLSSCGQDIILFIDNKLIPYALFEGAPKKIDTTDEKFVVTNKEARKLYVRLVRKVKRFYRKAFKIYKYGL